MSNSTQAAREAFLGIFKNAIALASSSTSLSPASKPSGFGKPAVPKSPSPGDYKPSFLDSSAQTAQRSSQDKLQAGESMTMPITR